MPFCMLDLVKKGETLYYFFAGFIKNCMLAQQRHKSQFHQCITSIPETGPFATDGIYLRAVNPMVPHSCFCPPFLFSLFFNPFHPLLTHILSFPLFVPRIEEIISSTQQLLNKKGGTKRTQHKLWGRDETRKIEEIATINRANGWDVDSSTSTPHARSAANAPVASCQRHINRRVGRMRAAAK